MIISTPLFQILTTCLTVEFYSLWNRDKPRFLVRAGPRGVVCGEALKAEGLNRATQAARGGEYVRGFIHPLSLGGGGVRLKKTFVSENAFQAIFKLIFPYSITSILRKVRHSNT